jgi:hypothetical protein
MKFAAAALAGLLGLCLSGTAQARDYTYVFGGYDYYDAKGGSLNGIGLGVGWRPSKYYAVELGGQYAKKSGVNFYNGYIQALGILPVANNLSLFVSLGGSYAQASTDIGPITISTNSSGYRAGIGAQYWIAPNWGLRASWHRQNALYVADDIGINVTYRF